RALREWSARHDRSEPVRDRPQELQPVRDQRQQGLNRAQPRTDERARCVFHRRREARAGLPQHHGHRARAPVLQGLVARWTHHWLRAHVRAHRVRPARIHREEQDADPELRGRREEPEGAGRDGKSRRDQALGGGQIAGSWQLTADIRRAELQFGHEGIMKIGVFAVLFGGKPFEEALDYIKELGLEAVEIGTGAYPGDAHCKPAELLKNDSKLKTFKQAIDRRGLTISALSCHGNPIHPDGKLAKSHDAIFRNTVQLAAKLGAKQVTTFSGCPGGDPKATQPNWITSSWPPEFPQMLEWQWKERVVPYWKDAASFLKKHKVRVAIEMHPNFVVYNPETMLRLCEIAPGT